MTNAGKVCNIHQDDPSATTAARNLYGCRKVGGRKGGQQSNLRWQEMKGKKSPHMLTMAHAGNTA